MKNIAKNKPWAKNFSIKSGTIEKVKAFAGYFYNYKGILYSFSILSTRPNFKTMFILHSYKAFKINACSFCDI